MDYGQRVVQEVFERLQIDEEWSLRTERGFTWWSGPLRQQVWAEEPFQDLGMTVVRVHARTDLLRSFECTEMDKIALCLLMSQGTLSGFVRDAEDPSRLQLASSVYVNESTANWMGELFTWAVITQNIEALLLRARSDKFFAGIPDDSVHPTSGKRDALDEMTSMIQTIVAPEGKQDSLYIGGEMQGLSAEIQEPPTVMASSDPMGLTSELPFKGRTSMLRMMTDASHPEMGHGLLVTLTLPTSFDDAVEEALRLNGRELSELTRSHFLGSWCVAPSGSFAFASFFSNSMYKPNLITHLYYSGLFRARWIAEEVFGDDWQNGGFQEAYDNKMAIWELLTKKDGAGEKKRRASFLSRIFGGGR